MAKDIPNQVNKENWLQTAGKSIKKGWNILLGRHRFEPRKMNRIDRYHYNLGKITRSITHLMFATLTMCAIGFSTKALGSINNNIDTSSIMGEIEKYVSYAPAFLGSTVVYGIPYGILSRMSVRKPMAYDTSDPNAVPIPKKFGFKTVFVIISLLPLIIWLIGQIVFIFVKRDWIKSNAEYWIEEKGYENIILDNYLKKVKTKNFVGLDGKGKKIYNIKNELIKTKKYYKMEKIKNLIEDYYIKENKKSFAENAKIVINNGQNDNSNFINKTIDDSFNQVKKLISLNSDE